MNEEENPPPTNKITIIFGIIIIAVLIGVLGYILFGVKIEPPKAKTVEYNYFKFEEVGGLWQTNIQLDEQPYEAIFRFNPEQVENVTITGNFTGFKKEPIYITFDPDVNKDKFKYLALAASEMTLHIVRALNFTVEAACTKNETEACINRTIVSCGDDASVIYIVSDEPTEITLNNSCIKLSGQGMELLKSVDRMLFQWYKIMSYSK